MACDVHSIRVLSGNPCCNCTFEMRACNECRALELVSRDMGAKGTFLLIIRDITDWEGGLERENCVAAQDSITACDVGSLAAFRR